MATTQTPTGVTCGNCHLKHASVQEVKDCYRGLNSPVVGDLPIPAAQPQMHWGRELPATDKQLEFMRKLASERGLTIEQREWTREQASAEIDRLKQTPRGETRTEHMTTEPESGMYRHPETGDILKVYRAVHGSGRMCAKRLVVETDEHDVKNVVHFDYLGLATRFIKGHVRMTLEDARQFGAIYGVCCVCGRTLTDEESIALGIGPVCGNREFGDEFKQLRKEGRG